MKAEKIKADLVVANEGQIEGLPCNPRRWSIRELQKLMDSIEQTPELLELRPLIVIKHGDNYVTIGGNMRLAALHKLGRDTIDCLVLPEDTPTRTLKEMVIKDNAQFGSWDPDSLANEWDDLPLGDWGLPFTYIPEEPSTAAAPRPDHSAIIEIPLTPAEFNFVTNKLRTIANSYEEAVYKTLDL